MSYNLFLDDERIPTDVTWENIPHTVPWMVVHSYDEFVKTVDTLGCPDMVSFDHDLGDFRREREMTGLDCARYLIQFCRNRGIDLPSRYWVHSMSPVGAMNIRRELFDYERERAGID